MAQQYIPTFDDWNNNMSFQGSTDARGKAKYYNAFLQELKDRPQYYQHTLDVHGLGKFAKNIEAPSMPGMSGMSSYDASAEKEKADALEAERVEEARIKQGGIDRDEAFTNYTNQSESANAYVDKLISQERSEAAIAGVDYVMTDELRQERVNNQFSTTFSDTDYTNLVDLYDEFGTPEGSGGYDSFTTVRGTGDAPADTSAAPATIASSGRTPAGMLAGDSEEDILGSTSILGGG